MQQLTLDKLIELMLRELWTRRHIVTTMFAGISLVILALGSVWPKVYLSTSLILSNQGNIIQPLMEGQAVTTQIRHNRAQEAREILFSYGMMSKIIEAGQWPGLETMSLLEQELLFENIKKRTEIANIGADMFRIQYSDTDPQRAFRTTAKFAHEFVTEASEREIRNSQDAFEFIDSEVKKYHEKLLIAETALKEFRSRNLDAHPSNQVMVTERIEEYRQRLENAKGELREAQSRANSLKAQISGESRMALDTAAENLYRAKIVEMQSEINTLKLSYHESYPDIVRLKHQILDMKASIEAEQQQKAQLKELDMNDETVQFNPVYQQLRTDLTQTIANIETLKTRVSEAENLFAAENKRAIRIHNSEAELAELTRDYEVNQETYLDLLRRRERAMISRSLDVGAGGQSYKINQPASLPITPHGIRFLHFLILGLIAGITIPLGVIYAFVLLDPRVRSESIIQDSLDLPLLAVIPSTESQALKDLNREKDRKAVKLLLFVLVVYIVTGSLKFTGAL